jgi:5'(3')-deoxyribonucleotidase
VNTLIDHIFLDMDGVLVNFTGRVAEEFGVDEESLNCWGIWGPLGISEQEFWDWLNSRPSKWWANLCPYPWAVELYEHCKGLAPVTFATSPSRSGACLSGKQEWLQKMFGKNIWNNFQMGVQKELLAQPGRILIDDADKNIARFQGRMGTGITFPRKWNEHADKETRPLSEVCHSLGYYNHKWGSEGYEGHLKAECYVMPEPQRAVARSIRMDMSQCGRTEMTIDCTLLN